MTASLREVILADGRTIEFGNAVVCAGLGSCELALAAAGGAGMRDVIYRW